MTERFQSLSCVRVRINEGHGPGCFIGCGRGWTALEVLNPKCDQCGRDARVTGSYTSISIPTQV